LNDAFTDIQWHEINEKAVRSEIIHIFINGHSIYDEAAFYELYVTGQITSKQGLDQFIQERVPGFSGKATKYRFLNRLKFSKNPPSSKNNNKDLNCEFRFDSSGIRCNHGKMDLSFTCKLLNF